MLDHVLLSVILRIQRFHDFDFVRIFDDFKFAHTANVTFDWMRFVDRQRAGGVVKWLEATVQIIAKWFCVHDGPWLLALGSWLLALGLWPLALGSSISITGGISVGFICVTSMLLK